MVLMAMPMIVLVAIVPALAQDGESDVISAGEPVSARAWGMAGIATPNTLMPGTCWTPPTTYRASVW